MKILIVDDEELARQRISDMLGKIDAEMEVREAANGKQALDIAVEENPDTVIMDIRMPVMDGLEAATHMSTLPSPPAVIFATAYDEHAIQAFEANAVDYLLKPVRLERLNRALEKAKIITSSRLESLPVIAGTNPIRTHLSISSTGKTILVPVSDIACFKADQKYVTAYWEDNQSLLDEPLKNFEQEFADTFFRIHRNALVALKQIESLEKTTDGGYIVRLKNVQEVFSVSRRHISELRKKLKKL